MKKVLFGALAALAMVSCSTEEVLEVNRANDVISYGVVANNSTRAENVYCNNNKPGSFMVYATHDGKAYISGDEIEYKDSKWTSKAGNTCYWPNEGAVDFFAHVNAGAAFNYTAGAVPTIENYTVDTDVAKQQDLLYAAKSQAKSAGAQVNLNFRHALSQVVFMAKNTNENIYVEISGVKVCNVGNKNTFTYPASKNTDNNIEDHSGAVGTITYDASWGEWNNLTGGTTVYPVAFTAVPVVGNNTAVSLTSENVAGKEYSSNAMILLPQTTTAWVPSTTEPKPADTANTYFLVNCLIYNVAGASVDKANDVCLWGEKDGGTYKAKEVAVPVQLTWEQGKKYVYTFVFGKGNGGYDPDPDDPSKPEPVLVPITFDVTVDDFILVSNTDVETGL